MGAWPCERSPPPPTIHRQPPRLRASGNACYTGWVRAQTGAANGMNTERVVHPPAACLSALVLAGVGRQCLNWYTTVRHFRQLANRRGRPLRTRYDPTHEIGRAVGHVPTASVKG